MIFFNTQLNRQKDLGLRKGKKKSSFKLLWHSVKIPGKCTIFWILDSVTLHLYVMMWSKSLEHNISPHASGRKIVKISGLFFARIKSFTKLYDAGKKWEVAS